MNVLKKLIKREKNCICVLGWRIPYHTELTGYSRMINIGPFAFPYEVDMESNMICIRFLGIRIPVKKANMPQKWRHYMIRDSLTLERRKRILQRMSKEILGYKFNFDDPKTINEKINWSKLYLEDPLITTCCDKYAVKEYVEKTVGKEHVVPLLGVYEKGSEIDFDALPDRFVLKVNWSSGYNIIVKDKSQIDREAIVRQIDEWMKPEMNSYYHSFNWGYKNMKPVVIAEKYLEQENGGLQDYKFHMNNGKLAYLTIVKDSSIPGQRVYTHYDSQLNMLRIPRANGTYHTEVLPLPENLEEMLEIARKLAEPFAYVRVDLYRLNEREIYLGEMTFYSSAGFCRWYGDWGRKLGDMIDLPIRKKAN